MNLKLCYKKNKKTINTSIYSKHLVKTTLWMFKLFVFSLSDKFNPLCVYLLIDLLITTWWNILWSRWNDRCHGFGCSEAVTLLFTSQKWGSRRRRAAPVWILLLFCQQIHKKYGCWVCVYQKRSRAATDHRLLSFCVGNESLWEWWFAARLGYLNTDGGNYAQTQLPAAAMLRAAVICSGDIAAPASLG